MAHFLYVTRLGPVDRAEDDGDGIDLQLDTPPARETLSPRLLAGRAGGQPAEDARDEEAADMSGPESTEENIREFWENAIIEWITKNAGVRKERIVKTRRFTEEPVNLSVVRVLNMMDDLVKVYNATYKKELV
jgi:hypothetical protein